MQHRYVGDVGDFGKYGLLRALLRGREDERLGVVWYLTDPEAHNNDGRHDGYLRCRSEASRSLYRSCDPELYDRLAEIRQRDELSVDMIEKAGILPSSALFWSSPVPTFVGRAEDRAKQEARWDDRDRWHQSAQNGVRQASLVFTDPDNGIIFGKPCDVRRRKPSHKHSYWHEIDSYLNDGISVVAYHHLGRPRGGHELFIGQRLRQISGLGWSAWAVRYRRGTARAFFVIPALDDHRVWLRKASMEFRDSWANHCSIIKNYQDAETD